MPPGKNRISLALRGRIGSNRSVKPWSPSAVRGRRSEQNRRIACDCRHLQPRPGPSHHGLTEQLLSGRLARTESRPQGRCASQLFRFPHRGGDLRSLRGKSVQEAFRGVPVCQGSGNRSLPPAKLADAVARTPSKATAASMSSWRRSSNGSRKTRPPTAAT